MKTYELNNGFKLTEEQINHWNQKLGKLESPKDIIEWTCVTFPHLFQTTAFGLTGLATIHMLSELTALNDFKMPPLIFIDTLHHFPQTLDLLQVVENKYYLPSSQKINVLKPLDCDTSVDFIEKYGDFLWEKDDTKYDFLAKVEPASRGYKELKVTAVFTGRRRSQGNARATLNFIEIDEINKIVKINPFADWSFDQVKSYIDENKVPYNELLDLGYKSIGDYHSTQPVKEGEDERAGRWKGQTKTECGIHETSKFAKYLQENAAN